MRKCAIAVILGLMLCSASACSTREASKSNLTSVYQSSLIEAESGRVISLQTAERLVTCGEMSPVAHWILERAPATNFQVRPDVFDYPEKDNVSYNDVIADAPPPFQNELNAEVLYDDSWDSLLLPNWTLSRHAEAYPELRSYSHAEIRCWSKLGDQLANRVMSDFYLKLEHDLERGFEPQDLDDWVFPKTPKGARDERIRHLQTAAETPTTPQVCEEFGNECPFKLLAPFPLGLPDAHRDLMWIGRKHPDLVLDGRIDAPSHHFRQFLRGGSSTAYYSYYETQPPEQ